MKNGKLLKHGDNEEIKMMIRNRLQEVVRMWSKGNIRADKAMCRIEELSMMLEVDENIAFLRGKEAKQ